MRIMEARGEVICPECGVGNEEGLFHVDTVAVKMCASCLMGVCSLRVRGSQAEVGVLTIVGITKVAPFDDRDVDLASEGLPRGSEALPKQ